jgi:hypothetical protein
MGIATVLANGKALRRRITRSTLAHDARRRARRCRCAMRAAMSRRLSSPVDARVDGLVAMVSSGAAMRFDDILSRAEQSARDARDRSSVHAAKPCRMRFSGEHAGSPSCLRCGLARAGDGWLRTSSQGVRAAVVHRIVGMSMEPRCDRTRGSRSVSSRHAMRVSTACRACHRIDVFVIAMRAHSMA